MSDGGEFWGGAILAGCVVWCIAAEHYQTVPQQPPQIGRFQIIRKNDATPILLDTVTGENWIWVYYPDKSGVPDHWLWEHEFTPNLIEVRNLK